MGAESGTCLEYHATMPYQQLTRQKDFQRIMFAISSKKPFYLAACEPMIYPVPGEYDWTRTCGQDIEPPQFHVKKGRRKEKRINGRFEVPKPNDSSRMATITCSNCGLQGHRYTNCKKELRPELSMRKNKHVVNPCELPLLISLLSFLVFCYKPLWLTSMFLLCLQGTCKIKEWR